MRCAILLKSKVTCDQLKKAASFLNTGGHDISDVFEPKSDKFKSKPQSPPPTNTRNLPIKLKTFSAGKKLEIITIPVRLHGKV